MESAIISALLVAIADVIVSVILNNKNQAVMSAKMEDYQRLTDYKIQELTKHVEKHNQVVERVAVLENDQKAVWKRLDDLKEKLES